MSQMRAMQVISQPSMDQTIRQSAIVQQVPTVQLPPPTQVIKQIVIQESQPNPDDELYIKKLEEELDEWRSQFLLIKTEHQTCAGNVHQIDILNQRIQILQEDIRKLNFTLRDTINESEAQRLVWYTIELENHDLKMSKLQLDRMHELLQIRSNELDESRKQISELEIQISVLTSSCIMQKDLENQVEILTKEALQWNNSFEESNKKNKLYIEGVKKSYEDFKNTQLNQINRTVEFQNNVFNTEIKNLRKQLEKVQQENEELRKLYQTYEIKNYEWTAQRQELEQQLKSSQDQNDRLEQQLNDKIKENENLRIIILRQNKGISI